MIDLSEKNIKEEEVRNMVCCMVDREVRAVDMRGPHRLSQNVNRLSNCYIDLLNSTLGTSDSIGEEKPNHVSFI